MEVRDKLLSVIGPARQLAVLARRIKARCDATEGKRGAADTLLYTYKLMTSRLSNVEQILDDTCTELSAREVSNLKADTKRLHCFAAEGVKKLRIMHDELGNAQYDTAYPMGKTLNFPELERDAAQTLECITRIIDSLAPAQRSDHAAIRETCCYSLHVFRARNTALESSGRILVEVHDQVFSVIAPGRLLISLARRIRARCVTAGGWLGAADTLFQVYELMISLLSNLQQSDEGTFGSFSPQPYFKLTANVKWLRNFVSESEHRLQNMLATLQHASCGARHSMRESLKFLALQRNADLTQERMIRIMGILALAQRTDRAVAGSSSNHSPRSFRARNIARKNSSSIVIDFELLERIVLTVTTTGRSFPKRISLDLEPNDDEDQPSTGDTSTRRPPEYHELSNRTPPWLDMPFPGGVAITAQPRRDDSEELWAAGTVQLESHTRERRQCDHVARVAEDRPGRIEAPWAEYEIARRPVELRGPRNGNSPVRASRLVGGDAAASAAGHVDVKGQGVGTTAVLRRDVHQTRCVVTPVGATDDKCESGEGPPGEGAARPRLCGSCECAFDTPASGVRTDSGSSEPGLNGSQSQWSAPRPPDATLRRAMVVMLFVLFSSAVLSQPMGCVLILVCLAVLFLEKANTNAGNFVETPELVGR